MIAKYRIRHMLITDRYVLEKLKREYAFGFWPTNVWVLQRIFDTEHQALDFLAKIAEGGES